jgi:23S rRNA pseudouridine1911/1915/1917 synthase
MTFFAVAAEQAGITLAAGLRGLIPSQSWSQVRRLVAARRVRINGEPCLDPARRLKEGDTVELLDRAEPPLREPEAILIRYLDQHLVVVEKPSGINTVRHPAERNWSARRKALSQTLEDIVPELIAKREGRVRKGPLPRLRVVHRLDKETSGLVVLARTVTAERELGKQFHRHTVVRRYLAIVLGTLKSQTIRSRLVRDRGDGRRGSTDAPGQGKEAVTHVEVVERLPGYTLVSCRLETGRTHQIRIHLAELGHPVCGEKVYNRALFSRDAERSASDALRSASRLNNVEVVAPRLALHATELGFVHPATKQAMHWTMPLPPDLAEFLEKLRRHER